MRLFIVLYILRGRGKKMFLYFDYFKTSIYGKKYKVYHEKIISAINLTGKID